MGMLIMDEFFDTWETHKSGHLDDYGLLFADWHEMDLRAGVRRDRNHPSVILWSIGNEISQQGSPRGNELALELTKIVRSEDPTRMTVTANSGVGFTGLPADEYVFGFNYETTHKFRYAKFHQDNPTVSIIASETASTQSSRGFYAFPLNPGNKLDYDRTAVQITSFDTSSNRRGSTPDAEWTDMATTPGVAGEFLWTGFDYLGEPGPFAGRNSPARSSYFGIMDLVGFKKDRFYLYQSHWRPDLPMAHIAPHWNWPDRVGQVTPVQVYTSGDEAELFLNGQSLGRKKIGPNEYRLRWDNVSYEPGELKVVAYKDGQPWVQDVVKTTGAATQISLSPDRISIHNDGQDIAYVTVAIKDKDGLIVPVADIALHYEISGPGEIVAVDNGDASSLAPLQGSSDSKAFNGLAMIIVRAKRGQIGDITLTAKSDGLNSASVLITASPKS